MKLEEIIAKCPKCGSQDKTVQRKMIDEQKAHAELKAIVCDNCGHTFETGKDEKEYEK
ncbi:MAG: TIGR04165 family Cys-rich peptide [Methanobrevibacter sp.]|nr:TIGR04165 family Cys-rich peptide [Methanobrevibacter sp.]